MAKLTDPALPPLPCPIEHVGYDWSRALSGGWEVVELWGPEGVPMGNAPYAIVCILDDARGVYAIARNTEGTLVVEAWDDRTEREWALERLALWYEAYRKS
ncbi:hypothetical protein [Nocardiopsis synnemataformans]|uniref:hypothetical protein n=1 Tax=Nocardiopsis synnemataformans TaxID=61305 RepID=UPI003EB785EE